MAATVETHYFTGAGPTESANQTAVRFHLADSITVDASAPLPLPASGENLSWRHSSKVNVTVTPAGSISNLRWFATTPATGINLYAWTNATYTQAVTGDTAGITGFTDTSGNKTAVQVGAASYATSSSPIVVNSGTVLTNPSTGLGTQNFVITQMGVLSTYAGGPGPISAVTITYRYSET